MRRVFASQDYLLNARLRFLPCAVASQIKRLYGGAGFGWSGCCGFPPGIVNHPGLPLLDGLSFGIGNCDQDFCYLHIIACHYMDATISSRNFMDDRRAGDAAKPWMSRGHLLQQAGALIAPLCRDKVGAPRSEAFALRCYRVRIET
jgi:hypothetical protein